MWFLSCLNPAIFASLMSDIFCRELLFSCCKTKLKKKYFFLKKYFFFTKYTLFAEKNNFIWKKNLYWFFFCLLKKLFFLQKMKKTYISFEKYFFIQKIHIHSAKKIFFDHKKYIKLRGELNNLVLKVSEAPNMWYYLN